MSQNTKGHLLAITTVTIWSSTFIISQTLLAYLTPVQILFFRYAIAVVFLSLIYPRFSKPISLASELFFFAIGSALALYFVFENSALQRTYSSNVSLIVATIPFLTGILSRVLYRIRFFNLKNTAGMTIAYLGVLLIIISTSRLEGVAPLGDLQALGASMMFAVYSVLLQHSRHTYHLIQLTRKVFLYGLLLLTILLFITGQFPIPRTMKIAVVMGIFYLGIVASSLAFILWNRAIQILGSNKTNLYIYLIPVLTTAASAVLLKEKITWMTILGTLLILAGLYLSERRKRTQEKDETRQTTYSTPHPD